MSGYSDSDSSSDYDRRRKQRRKDNVNKRRQVVDDDDDYERYHKKKRKGIPVKAKKKSIPRPPPRRQKKEPSSDSEESDEIPVKKRVSVQRKQRSNISTSDSSEITPEPKQKPKPKAIRKPAIKTPTKRKKKVRKVQSEKVQLKSEKKRGAKPTKNGTKSLKKKKKSSSSSKKGNDKNRMKKATTPTPIKKGVSKKKKGAKKAKLKTGTPTPAKKRRQRRMRKAQTMTAGDMNLDKLFGDDEKYAANIGNTIDLSEYALDSKKRNEIKATKNKTYGEFRVKINYRYRLDDNRIGWCRYFGVPLFAKGSEEYIGLVIQYNGEGENDGSVQNKYYFRCRQGKGLFVRPFRLIEDLGINTKQLSKQEIAGSDEMKQLMKDIRDGKRPIHPNIVKQKEKERKEKEKSLRKKYKRNRKKVKARKKPLKERSKTVTNLDDKGEWKPPDWINEMDKDHGYDFLSDRPFHTKGYLESHKWKDSGVSVTAFNKKNHY